MKSKLRFVLILAAGLLSACGKKADSPPPVTPPIAVRATNTSTAGIEQQVRFDKLPGKWRRPDGGYVLEIRGVEPGGKMDAGYANPRPIHVAKAEASQDGTTVKVFIELRDVNYPGSTYTLAFDPGSDQLKGIYYQAALQESFEVFFERMK